MSSKKAWVESVGVTKAAVRYHTNRQYIYRWMKRYNGTLHSLENRSHRPHRHPNQHTPEEIKLIPEISGLLPKRFSLCVTHH